MDEQLQPAVAALTERLSAQVTEFRGEISLVLSTETIVAACQILRDEFGFDMLALETAVDYWPQTEPRFHMVYRLYSFPHNRFIGLRVPLSGNAPSLPTVETVYPNANWHEREVWDLFGIAFDGHSDMRRILMPHDWEGHPLRKDYPLGYEEVQFTFNGEEVSQRKPHPTD
jgi:NADH-quinone oxidoreductase subunit C